MYSKRQAMCPPCYYQSANGPMVTHALWLMMCSSCYYQSANNPTVTHALVYMMYIMCPST